MTHMMVDIEEQIARAQKLAIRGEAATHVADKQHLAAAATARATIALAMIEARRLDINA